MTFDELTDAVLDLTVRADKDSLARQKINSVIRAISMSGTYWPDLVEAVLSDHTDFSLTSNTHSLWHLAVVVFLRV